LADAELTREIFGNVDSVSKSVFYVLTALSIASFVYGIARHVRLWRVGRKTEARFQFVPTLRHFISRVLTQRTVRGRGAASVAHLLLFSGFVVLTIGTTLVAIEHYAHDLFGQGAKHPIFHKGLYFAVFEIVTDTFGIALIVGALWFACRRARGGTSIGHNASDWAVLGAILFLGFSGYLVEGLRIIRENPAMPAVSYVGLLCAKLSEAVGVTRDNVDAFHLALWWTHSVVALGLIAAVPYCRLMHVIAGSLSVATQDRKLGSLQPVSMEEVEQTGRIGAGRVQDFTRRQLLELDACVSCGRCQDACPAFEAGKPLSPRDVVQDIKAHRNQVGPKIVVARKAGKDEDEVASGLLGESLGAETVWSCTTCNACEDVCPLGVSPVNLITDMRRHLIGEGELRGSPAAALQKTQRHGNPWGLPKQERFDWAEGLDVPTVKDHPDFDVLYWIGCAASYDRRIQKVARAVVRLLKHANVNFAVLGPEERCTGESARRMGDEFVFQELAEGNIETLNRYNVRTIVTHCPHCLNSFRQDYPQFGGRYEVVHHSTFIQRLVEQDKLPRSAFNVTSDDANVTYHDPCYLARTQDETESPPEVAAPRQLIQLTISANGNITEPNRRGRSTSCCGAGGGRMWFDDGPETRIGRQRVEELLATGADTVAVACPFCLTMVSDGVAAQKPDVRVIDIAELLADALSDKIPFNPTHNNVT
jgi:Fe-S oxidoreductase/nitrate reductase gamma subunit